MTNHPTPGDIAALFVANLRRLVDASGLTQAAVAAKAWPGAKPTARERRLRKLLSGARRPTIDSLAGLCVALAAKPGEFFN